MLLRLLLSSCTYWIYWRSVDVQKLIFVCRSNTFWSMDTDFQACSSLQNRRACLIFIKTQFILRVQTPLEFIAFRIGGL
ncbi:hypothetical protein D3C73_721280 [compost metagenome]